MRGSGVKSEKDMFFFFFKCFIHGYFMFFSVCFMFVCSLFVFFYWPLSCLFNRTSNFFGMARASYYGLRHGLILLLH